MCDTGAVATQQREEAVHTIIRNLLEPNQTTAPDPSTKWPLGVYNEVDLNQVK